MTFYDCEYLPQFQIKKGSRFYYLKPFLPLWHCFYEFCYFIMPAVAYFAAPLALFLPISHFSMPAAAYFTAPLALFLTISCFSMPAAVYFVYFSLFSGNCARITPTNIRMHPIPSRIESFCPKNKNPDNTDTTDSRHIIIDASVGSKSFWATT